jgi:hypothetical protein
MREVIAYANDVCWKTGSASSMSFSYPYESVYSSANCASASLLTTYDLSAQTCFESDDYVNANSLDGIVSAAYTWSEQTGQYPAGTSVSGYLVVAYTEDNTCTSVPSTVAGFALNTCQPDANSPYSSFNYVCSESGKITFYLSFNPRLVD